MNQSTIPVNLNRTHRLTHRLVEIVEWVQLVEVVISMGVLESVVMEMEMEMAESVEANRESMEAEVQSMAVVMEMAESAESAEAKGESVEVMESMVVAM